TPRAHRQPTLFHSLHRSPLSPTLFPTRRSSDLDRQARQSRAAACVRRRQGDLRLIARRTNRRDSQGQRPSAHYREYDHVAGNDEIGRATSELQSRGHLVCRLLLEKKNTKSTATR